MPVLSSPFPAHFDRWLRVAGPIVLFLTGLMFFRLKMYVDLPRELWLNQVTIALSAGFIGWNFQDLLHCIYSYDYQVCSS